MKWIKQLLCRHKEIETVTESYCPENIFIVKSKIQCKKCEKTFDQHPNADCCYIKHLHSQLMQEYWIQRVKNNIQYTSNK